MPCARSPSRSASSAADAGAVASSANTPVRWATWIERAAGMPSIARPSGIGIWLRTPPIRSVKLS
ncbi:MAG TPA: hypothetical protein VNR66_10540 [Solirubrobacteraceae bacterium]|nr:hypothetical protein [Solirubrobacteraceae bacterium]